MKKLAILGSGAFAVQLVDHVIACGQYEFVGFIDETKEFGTIVEDDFKVIGHDKDIYNMYEQGIFDCLFIGIGYAQTKLKAKLYNKVKGRIPLANIIHPSAVIFHKVRLGEGIVVGAQSFIGRESNIKDNVAIMNCCCIEHNATIGSHTYIASSTAMAGNVTIGKSCFIGMNTSIKNDLTIGNSAILGIGSVVISDVNDNNIFVGNPAKFLRGAESIEKRKGT